jgi:hypothetical protein
MKKHPRCDPCYTLKVKNPQGISGERETSAATAKTLQGATEELVILESKTLAKAFNSHR